MNYTSGPMTTKQVAEVFGVTISTVKRWADEGKLPSFRTPGGHYRFRPDDIESIKASTTTVGAAS